MRISCTSTTNKWESIPSHPSYLLWQAGYMQLHEELNRGLEAEIWCSFGWMDFTHEGMVIFFFVNHWYIIQQSCFTSDLIDDCSFF